ncbi:acyl-CoA carboxylase epsilon subunit [Streptomyces sp. DSM 116494]|uniref:acyl-CoA carboxylase epsilon subunit n=1 Tax=Streptomyces TaxID=1883 RepID=UPI0036559C19
MNASRTAPLSVLRGNPTAEELAALLVVLGAARPDAGTPGPPPGAGRGWGRPTAWSRLEHAARETAGWRHIPAPSHGRTT